MDLFLINSGSFVLGQGYPGFLSESYDDLKAPLDFSSEPIEADTEMGIDTSDSDIGNWYEKLRWWKEAKKIFNDGIRPAIEQLAGIEKDYEELKKKALTPLEDFKKILGTDHKVAMTHLDAALAETKKKLDELTKDNQPLTDEQKKLVTSLEAQQKLLTDTKQLFEQYSTMYDRLLEAFNSVVPSQIQQCRMYDEKALDFYERIENVLNDKKAQSYYQVVENSLENIKAIINYLIGPMRSFIDQSNNLLQQLMPKIKANVASLEKEDILLRPLTEKERAEKELREKKLKEARVKMEQEKKAAQEYKALSWWQKIFYWISSFFSCIWQKIFG